MNHISKGNFNCFKSRMNGKLVIVGLGTNPSGSGTRGNMWWPGILRGSAIKRLVIVFDTASKDAVETVSMRQGSRISDQSIGQHPRYNMRPYLVLWDVDGYLCSFLVLIGGWIC